MLRSDNDCAPEAGGCIPLPHLRAAPEHERLLFSALPFFNGAC